MVTFYNVVAALAALVGAGVLAYFFLGPLAPGMTGELSERSMAHETATGDPR